MQIQSVSSFDLPADVGPKEKLKVLSVSHFELPQRRDEAVQSRTFVPEHHPSHPEPSTLNNCMLSADVMLLEELSQQLLTDLEADRLELGRWSDNVAQRVRAFSHESMIRQVNALERQAHDLGVMQDEDLMCVMRNSNLVYSVDSLVKTDNTLPISELWQRPTISRYSNYSPSSQKTWSSKLQSLRRRHHHLMRSQRRRRFEASHTNYHPNRCRNQLLNQ